MSDGGNHDTAAHSSSGALEAVSGDRHAEATASAAVSPVVVVERYVAALAAGDVAALADVVHPDVVGHEPTGRLIGGDQLRHNVEAWLTAYPDMELRTQDLFGDADRAAWRWMLDATHAPSGRRVAVWGIIVFRVAGGRIVEYWGQYDRLGLREQQGTAG